MISLHVYVRIKVYFMALRYTQFSSRKLSVNFSGPSRRLAVEFFTDEGTHADYTYHMLTNVLVAGEAPSTFIFLQSHRDFWQRRTLFHLSDSGFEYEVVPTEM